MVTSFNGGPGEGVKSDWRQRIGRKRVNARKCSERACANEGHEGSTVILYPGGRRARRTTWSRRRQEPLVKTYGGRVGAISSPASATLCQVGKGGRHAKAVAGRAPMGCRAWIVEPVASAVVGVPGRRLPAVSGTHTHIHPHARFHAHAVHRSVAASHGSCPLLAGLPAICPLSAFAVAALSRCHLSPASTRSARRHVVDRSARQPRCAAQLRSSQVEMHLP